MHLVRDFCQSSQAAWTAANGAGSFDPLQLSAVIGAMLDPGSASTVVTGLGISSLADNFGGSPATCATDASRPPLITTSNNEKVAQGVNDFLAFPRSTANNQLVTWWWAGFVLLDDIVATKHLVRYGVTNQNSLVLPTESHRVSVNVSEALQFVVCNDATATSIRLATGPTGRLTNTAYVFVTCEFNGNFANESDRVVMSFDGVTDTVTFSDSVGTPGAMPFALQGQPASPANIALLNLRSDTNLVPFIGKVGLQYFGKAAEAGITAGCLSPATRLNLANFRRPII